MLYGDSLQHDKISVQIIQKQSMLPSEQSSENPFPQSLSSEHSSSRSKENAPPLSDRRSESSKQRMDLQGRLDSLNSKLHYSGFNKLKVCLCDPASVDSILEVIHGILEENARQANRVRQVQNEWGDQRTLRMLREKEKIQLIHDRDNFARDRDSLQEKMKAIARDQREKEEKWGKEKEGFNKDRRSWMQREDATRNHTRNLEQKIRQLQDKLKKTMQKGDKSEFRNANFELITPLSRAQRSMMQREYEQGVAKSIQQHTRTLQEQNQVLRQLMKEIFSRLQRVAHIIDPQGIAEQHRPEIVDLPSPRGRTYPDLLRKFITAIEERTNQLKAPPIQGNSYISCDAGELMQTVSRLKGFYANWEAVNQSRKKIMPGLLELAAERGRLAKLAEIARDEGQDEQEVEAEDYVTQKMEYFKREFQRVNRWTVNLQSHADIKLI